MPKPNDLIPKPNDLTSIINALEPAKNADPAVLLKTNPHYFLFLLGTDTIFVPKPTKGLAVSLDEQKSYENGETLSYVAQVVATTLGETKPEINIAHPLSFSTDSVDVLNGPTTMGSEVGERIAQGVFLILKALAEGKSTIQIPAHSRGAVQAILISHEIERIKKELEQFPDRTLHQILNNTPCSYYTKKAFAKFSEVNELKTIRSTLLARLKAAKINMFLIDPVPGGSYMMIPGIAWRDERFYVKPPCTDLHLVIVRDERTCCFRPIIPQGCIPLIVPGHHGTASGNIYSQQFQPVKSPTTGAGTASVQQLMVYKILDFVNKNTGIFEPPALNELAKNNINKKPVEQIEPPALNKLANNNINKKPVGQIEPPALNKLANNNINKKPVGQIDPPVALEHPSLDELTTHYLSKETAERSKKLLDLYQQILDNDLAFKEFAGNSYRYLGSERTSSGARYVHSGAHNGMSLDSIIPNLQGNVNKEHALLALKHQMEFRLEDNDSQPDLLIEELGQLLTKLIADFANNVPNNKLNTEEGRKTTYNFLAFFIDTISQKYLNNHVTVEVKTNLLDRMEGVFSALDSCKSKNLSINNIINKYEDMLRKGLKNTAEIHYKALIEQSNAINEKLSYSTDPTAINHAFKEFLKLVEETKNSSDLLAEVKSSEPKIALDPLTSALLKPILEEKNSADLKLAEELQTVLASVSTALEKIMPVTIDTIREAYNSQFEQIKSSRVADIAIKLLVNLSSHPACRLKGYLELNPLDEATYIKDLDRLHENMNNLLDGRVHVQQLVGKELLAMDFELLIMHRDRAIKLAAQYLIKKEVSLKVKPALMSDVFYTAVKEYARSLNVYDAEHLVLEREYEKLSEDSKQLKQTNEALDVKLIEAIQIRSKLELVVNDTQKQNDTLKIRLSALDKEIGVLNVQLSTLKQANEQIHSQLAIKNSASADLQKRYEETVKTKYEVEKELERIAEERSHLVTQVAQLEEQQVTLKRQLSSEQTDKIELRQKTQRVVTELSDANNQLKEMSSKLQTQLSDVEQKHEATLAKHTELTKKHAALIETSAQLQQSVTDLQDTHQQTLDNSVKLETLLRDIKQERDVVIGELTAKLAINEQLQKDVIQLTNDKKDLITDGHAIKQKVTQLQAELAGLDQKYKTAIVGEQTLSKNHRELNELNSKLSQNLAELQKNNADIMSNSEVYKNQFTQLQSEHGTVQNQLTKLQQQNVDLGVDNEKLKKDLADLEAKFADLKKNNAAEYSKSQTENANIIDELQKKIAELQKIIDDNNKKHASDIADLKKTQQDNETLIAELQVQNTKKDELIKQLHTSQEVECAHLIHTKLLPLTEEYLLHLISEAKKINPAEADYSASLPAFSGKEADRSMYDKINVKFVAVKQLLVDLNDIDKNPLPSERIISFTETLQNKNGELKDHRDAAWKQYFKTTIIAIGVICSGIIPGIIVLLAYSAYADKSSPLFFTKSIGGECADKLQSALAKVSPAA